MKFRGKIETNLELGCERVETEGRTGAGGGFWGGEDWRKSANERGSLGRERGRRGGRTKGRGGEIWTKKKNRKNLLEEGRRS